MADAAPVDRRQHERRSFEVTCRLAHDQSRRSFPCRCVDASAGGAKLLVPMTMPVRAGHVVHIELAEAMADPVRGFGEGKATGTVVRVDRQSLLTHGPVVVGVSFPIRPDGPSESLRG